MKNHLKYFLGFTFFIGILIFSCKHDIQQTEVNQPSGAILSINEAQQWFEGQPV